MKKLLMLSLISCCFITTGCSLEDFGFEYSTGTGLNLTKEKYDRIQDGSSYDSIKTIIGGECDNYYSDEEEDWYTCIDDSNSSKRIVLGFKNGKLYSKSSSGLN